MISYYQKTVTSKNLREIPEFKIGSWVYVEHPTSEDIAKLSTELKLDDSLITDATDPYEVPRVEVVEGIVYIFTRLPYQEDGQVLTAPVLLGVADSFVFTVTERGLPFKDKFIEGKIEFNTTQKVRFLLQILSETDAAYTSFLNVISKDVRRLQNKLTTSIENSDIVSFVHYESMLSDLLDALLPSHTMLQNVLSGKVLSLHPEDKEYTEDLTLETGQLIERARANLRNIVNVRNAYSTIMTNNLNRTIKLLTGITIILMVPSLIVNIFGMNVHFPLEENAYAFAGIVVTTLFVTGGVFWFFNRKNWV